GLARPCILELGAGTGSLAGQILPALAARGLADVSYRILEPSADLRERQRARLAHHAGRVVWLDGLPREPFQGVVLANEVVDALPASRFVKRGAEVRPLGVGLSGGELAWREGPEQPALTEAVRALESRIGRALEDGYESEIRLQLPAW